MRADGVARDSSNRNPGALLLVGFGGSRDGPGVSRPARRHIPVPTIRRGHPCPLPRHPRPTASSGTSRSSRRSGAHPVRTSLPTTSMAAAATRPARHVFWSFQVAPSILVGDRLARDLASSGPAGSHGSSVRANRRASPRPPAAATARQQHRVLHGPACRFCRSCELAGARGRRVLGAGRKWHRDVPRPEYGQDVRPRDAPRPQGTAAPSEADAPRPGSNTQVHGGSRIPRL